MRNRAILLVAAVAICGSGAAAQAPLSAIDWLNDVVTAPVPVPEANTAEPSVTRGVTSEAITVTALDAPTPDAVGLLPRAVSGFPANLWGDVSSAELIALLEGIESRDLLPATRDLLFTLLLAELDPPIDSDPRGRLFLARVDTLIRLGAVESAQALLRRAGIDTPGRFSRWFGLSLLLGTETDACQHLVGAPGLSRDLRARVFCLARSGDWNAAALSYETGVALGEITGSDQDLLLQFLDPELAEGDDAVSLPVRPDPLTFFLYEAVGSPLATGALPVAYAHADLRANSGWKAQIEAAERLSRVGALPANQLLGLYTDRRPAASGGVWTRVDAIQTLDIALNAASEDAISRSLPIVWEEMHGAGLEAIFAELYGPRLQQAPMTADTRPLAFQVALLTDAYERAAQTYAPQTDRDRFLAGVARGLLQDVPTPTDQMAAIAEGFTAAQPPARFQPLIDGGSLGAALLHGIKTFGDGANGDIAKLSDALALFRALGLEDAARRATLQALILERRG